MFETMLRAATTMTSATVAKITAFSSRSANASGAFKSRHVWTRYAAPSRARAAEAASGASEASRSFASQARAPAAIPERSRAVGSSTSTSGAFSTRLPRWIATTRTAVATGIGPRGESRVREERIRTTLPRSIPFRMAIGPATLADG